jgi:DNA-binding NtrC family response regulator
VPVTAHSKLTVLVVEDDFELRQSITDFLTALGHTIIEAESGEAALAVLQRRDHLDVLFTDVRLEGDLNGWDLGEAFRAVHPGCVVIYTSGATTTSERPVAGSLFFPKPYDLGKVHAACLELAEI